MERYKKLLMRKLSIRKRVDTLVDLATQRVNPAVSKAALERADEICGLQAPKVIPQDVPLINIEMAGMVGIRPLQARVPAEDPRYPDGTQAQGDL